MSCIWSSGRYKKNQVSLTFENDCTTAYYYKQTNKTSTTEWRVFFATLAVHGVHSVYTTNSQTTLIVWENHWFYVIFL